MVDDLIHRAHPVHCLGIVGPAEEEDLACKLLPDLLGQVRGAVTRIKGSHVGVGLLEQPVFARGQREITDHV